MNLTRNFTLEEATFSQTATRLGIDNTIPEHLKANVLRQAEFMERIRWELNAPIFITSWYRCPELNKAIGGATQSAHMLGLACDFVSPFGSPLKICQALQGKLDYDQLIDEGTWVHIGLSEGIPRKQVLTARFPNGKAVYTNGLTEAA